MSFDGDQALWTNNPTIINSIVDKFKDGSNNYPVVDIFEDENRAETIEEEYNINNLIKYDLKTLDNRIGKITNIATYYSNKGYEDLKKYDKEIVRCRLLQGSEIDFVKHGFREEIPDSFNEASRYKPYFLQKHKYNRDKNIQQDVVDAPLNILCHDIEVFEKELFKIDKVKVLDTLKYIRDTDLINENLTETNRLYIELQQIHEQFKKESSSIYLKCRNKSDKYRQKVYDSFYNKYHAKVNQLSNDKELLSSIAVQINYVQDKVEKKDRRSYLFPWVTTWEGLTYTINKTAPATVKIPRKLSNKDMVDKDNLIEFLGNMYEVKEVTNKLDADAFINKEYERKIDKELKQQVKSFELETTLCGFRSKSTNEVVDIINNSNLHLGEEKYNGKNYAGIFVNGEYVASIKHKTEEFLDDEVGFIDLKQMNNKINVDIIETSTSSIKVRLQIAG